ncbi:MAG: COX15/CtaA family protein [Alphaproteobacteria bacterium]|nr:COX15/CtaA family protein [Alphaproteobacteria bacterium]
MIARRESAAAAWWLLGCCFMVAVMVALGGLTRLTHSGLSMAEWRPLHFLPPLSEAEWQDWYAKYRLTPEFLKINSDMTIEGFKGIFWLEFIHRLWGRALGLAFLLPMLWLAFTGRIERRRVPQLGLVFLLGAAQGGMGWWMVASGLIDHPDVSHYRLTAHLGLAFLLHALMFWLALDILGARRLAVTPAVGRLAGLVVGLVAVTALFGGLVAGLDAGLIYNTFPLMDGHLIPDGLTLSGILDDIKTVQFTHRVLALSTTAAVVALWLKGRDQLGARADLLLAAVTAQVGLGVATLVLVVPVALASVHQVVALVLLTAALWVLHGARVNAKFHQSHGNGFRDVV